MTGAAIHEKAAVGFSTSVDAYERGRPGYSEAALSFIRETIHDLTAGVTGGDGASGSRRKPKVLDLAAGTGKFTNLVNEPAAWDLFAVEPVIEMRERLIEKLPSVIAFPGTAEQIPFDDNFFDVVTVAQAFHWFNYEQAVREIARVLRPGGRLILIWNLRDESGASWVSRLSKILDRYESDVPRYKTMRWKSGFQRHPNPFREVGYQTFGFDQVGDLAVMRDRVASISFIASLPLAERKIALNEMENVFISAMNAEGVIRMPYRTHVYVYQSI
ncbi:MAG: class I SAM-dependent methyltransferase [Deltaproteobacteria bacterium]|nr:class I SAM-dependent methyltransferase [Deltaproteobacteria bacterium]